MLDIRARYFNWLCDIVDTEHCNYYTKLLNYLFSTYFVQRKSPITDSDRINDAEKLRELYFEGLGIDTSDENVQRLISDSYPRLLEVMVALARRGESQIMHDPEKGDRTSYWFWCMIKSLGLTPYSDSNFRLAEVNDIVEQFLGRRYKANGSGGLFTCEKPEYDMRTLDIWQQMCFWFSEILEKEGFFK